MYLPYWLLLQKLLMKVRLLSEEQLSENQLRQPVSVEQVASLQQQLVLLLNGFRHKLEAKLQQGQVRDILLPVALALDEWLLKKYFQDRPHDWPLLQTKLFQLEHGGEQFYQLLDQQLTRSEVTRFVLEIYYFFLKNGFCGMYFNAPDMRNRYLKALENKLMTAND